MSEYEYSQYNEFNRFSNLDGIEPKIIAHLLTSESKYAEMFWKILKYPTMDAFINPPLTLDEKKSLIDGSGTGSVGLKNGVRLFLTPFVDDAYTEECASVYIFVDDIYPQDASTSIVSVTVETVVHNKVGVLENDADLHDPNTNPNEYYKDNEEIVYSRKSRETVLLKCILAELNGLYIDGVGYLQFNSNKNIDVNRMSGKATLSLFNGSSFFGHSIRFSVLMSGISESDEYGY